MQTFLSDVRKAGVRIEERDGKQYVTGLPILRPGRWKGLDYSVSDLQRMAQNFHAMSEEQSFQPGLWPMHNFDDTGRPMPQKASDVLGYFTDLRFDADLQMLVGDVESTDPSLIEDMNARKLRYISAEWASNRSSPGRVLTGAAWVADPAVKGMPWEIVMNAADYGHEPAPPQTRTAPLRSRRAQKGGRHMSIVTKVRDALSGLVGKTLSEEEIDALAADLGDLDEEPTTPDAVKPDAETAKALTAMQAELAAQKEAHGTLVAAHAAEMRVMRAKGQVQALLDGRHIIPAVVEPLTAILSEIGDENMVHTLADGKEQKVSVADTLVAVLQSNQAIGEAYFQKASAPVDKDAEKANDELVASMAASVKGKQSTT